jgi:hypothetical protein
MLVVRRHRRKNRRQAADTLKSPPHSRRNRKAFNVKISRDRLNKPILPTTDAQS